MSEATETTVENTPSTNGKGAGALLKEVQSENGSAPAAPAAKPKNGKKAMAEAAKPAEEKPKGLQPTLDFFNLPEPEPMVMKRKEITLDKKFQHRTQIQDIREGGAVDQYTELMREGVEFPPVIVVIDETEKANWLVDGFQRIGGYTNAGITDINVLAYRGNVADALLLSCGSNGENSAIPRTKDDAKRSVWAILDNPALLDTALKSCEGNGGIHRGFAKICKCAIGTVDAAMKAKNLQPGKGANKGKLVKFTPPVTPDTPPEPRSEVQGLLAGSGTKPAVSPEEQRKVDISGYEQLIQREDEELLGKAVERAKQLAAVFAKYMTDPENVTEVRGIMAKHGVPLSDEFDKEAAREGNNFSPYHAMLEHWSIINSLTQMAEEVKAAIKAKKEAAAEEARKKADAEKAQKEADAAKKKEEAEKAKSAKAQEKKERETNGDPENVQAEHLGEDASIA